MSDFDNNKFNQEEWSRVVEPGSSDQEEWGRAAEPGSGEREQTEGQVPRQPGMPEGDDSQFRKRQARR